MFIAQFLHFVEVDCDLLFDQIELLFAGRQFQAMMGFHIAGRTFFEFARFFVFAIAVNQSDKRFRVCFSSVSMPQQSA
jgi:hypothetical protein